MNRNTESHFSNTPTVSISRSKFDRSHDCKTTFDAGDLVPIYCDCTIMPGDTVKMDMSEVVRMMTPITPVMDNANLDIYFFFVPYRLIWDKWKRFWGENDTAPWAQQTEYTIPMIANYNANSQTSDKTIFKKGSIADYLGYPTNISANFKASALPFRCYCTIWNEWFRDENLQNPVNTNKDRDTDQYTKSYDANNFNEVTDTCGGGGKPLKVCKYHDYFTSALPQAQKGNPVYVPLGENAPVRFYEADGDYHDAPTQENLIGKHVNITRSDQTVGESNIRSYLFGYKDSTNTYDLTDGKSISLYTDLSQAVGATVNQLRQAFAIQKFYERQALGGTRYTEMIKAHWGVTNPDYRMQRPEYLGGKRIPINMNQVVQATQSLTDSGEATTGLGTTGAYSVTSDRDSMFTHSFTEHGILMGLACVRTVKTYQQGLNRQYSQKKLTDFYVPEFANLGNMAILEKEIYLQGTEDDETAFGYQEAWANYRYFPNIVTGEMRSNVDDSLDIWHWADNYDEAPSLGDKWIQEDKSNIERTLAVQNHNQFFGDFYFKAIYTRPMPLYSIPGLIDHH